MALAASTFASAFKNPDSKFSPTPIWWWSGETLEPERLHWQMQQMAQAGVYNLVILNLAPAGPLHGRDADDPPLFTERWWEIFLGVCEQAKTLGMQLYFYDQIGFSGANFQGQLASRDPRCQGRSLLRQQQQVAAGEEASLPVDCEPLAAFFWSNGAKHPQQLAMNGHTIAAPAAGRLLLIGNIVQGFDYFNIDAGRALLETVHGQFEHHAGAYLGDVIVGSFQDELPDMPTWSVDFAERFHQRYGYDLIEHLWMLWEGEDTPSMRVRTEYHALRAALAEAAFFKPFFDWHERHGLICGFDQQGPARAGDLFSGVRSYADYLKTHRWYAAPGADHHGEAHIHRSLADAYERPRTWIEGFHSTGWGGTLEETFDWLLPWMRSGANLYNPHAVYYSTRGGWWEWAPPSTCFRQPYWRHYKSFADAVARCCHALTLGQHQCNLAVYYPTSTAQAGCCLDGALDMVRDAQDKLNQLGGKAFWQTAEAGLLDEAGRDYNFLDDTMLQDATVHDGGLHVGEQDYQTIILPSAVVMDAETLQRMLAFAEAGGTLIVYGEQPRHILNDGQDHVRRQWLRACESGQIQQATDSTQLRDLLKQHPPLIEAPIPVHHRRLDHMHFAFVPATVLRATEGRQWTGEHYRWCDYAYRFNREHYAQTTTITLRKPAFDVQAWSPVSGMRCPVEVQQTADGVQVTLAFDEGPALWLTWQDQPEDAANQDEPKSPTHDVVSTPSLEELTSLPSTWSCTLLPTVDNRYGDMLLPASETLPLQTWFAEQVEDAADQPAQVDWSHSHRAHATFGPFGWRKTMPADEPLEIGRDTDPPGEDWHPVSYSLSRGIEAEDRTLGVCGHAPEDFLDLRVLEPGQAAHFRTWIPSDQSRQVILMVGGAGEKQVGWNGQMLESKTGYRQQWSVNLEAGLNRLDFCITPIEYNHWPLRAQWCLMSDELTRPWPRRIAWPGESHQGRVCRFQTEIDLDQPVTAGVIQVLSLGATTLLIDGKEIGRHGAFGPYARLHPKGYHYHCPPLSAGRHTVEFAVTDGGLPPCLTLDAELTLADGAQHLLVSTADWTVRAKGIEPQPVALTARGGYDSGHEAMHRRPHPLPRTNWLEQSAEPSPMLDVVPDAFPQQSRRYWLRWQTPPGARSMTLSIAGEAKLWVDGQPVRYDVGQAVTLPGDSDASREVMLRVDAAAGLHDGAVFEDAVTYEEAGPGRLALGDWTQQGLEAWSGGVQYEQTVTLDNVPAGRLLLDLGEVRGTVEVQVNGQNVGERFCAPWRLDITDAVRQGANAIQVSVFNTLGPWLFATSPTLFVFPGQCVSGLMGPVRLVVQRAISEPSSQMTTTSA